MQGTLSRDKGCVLRTKDALCTLLGKGGLMEGICHSLNRQGGLNDDFWCAMNSTRRPESQRRVQSALSRLKGT